MALQRGQTSSGMERLFHGAAKSFTNFRTQITALKPADPKIHIKVSTLQIALTEKYSRLSTQIETLQNDDKLIAQVGEDVFFAKCDEVEQLYVNLKLELSTLANVPDEPAAHSTPLSNSVNVTAPLNISSISNSRCIPAINVPKFSGDSKDWTPFFARFSSIVHDNATLTNLQKLQLLQEALPPKAFAIISHLELSEQNYRVAVDVLTERFFKPRKSINYHSSRILNLPKLNSSSPHTFNEFLDTFQTSYEALKANSNVNDVHETIVSTLLYQQFDKPLARKFEDSFSNKSKYPTVKTIVQFLINERDRWDDADQLPESRPFPSSSSRTRGTKPIALLAAPTSNPVPVSSPTHTHCYFCKANNHRSISCSQFLNLAVKDRWSWVNSHHRCHNCLGSHHVSNCSSKWVCTHCQRKHHSLLHNAETKSSNISHTAGSSTDSKSANTKSTTSPTIKTNSKAGPVSSVASLICNTTTSPVALMATCLIRLQTSPSNFIVVRAILDSGSGASFISKECADRLKCPISEHSLTIGGIGNYRVGTLGKSSLDLASIKGRVIFPHVSFHLLINMASHTPTYLVSTKVRAATSHLTLADPTFDTPSPIDCILGSDLTAQLLFGHGDPLPLGEGLPLALPTPFGYVLMGTAPSRYALNSKFCSSNVSTPLSCLLAAPSSTLEEIVQRFWEVEEPPSLPAIVSKEEEQCEALFTSDTTRDESGRYIVSLPFITPITSQLGDSFNRAYASFASLERRFRRDTIFKSAYVEFINDYIIQGHMCPANSSVCYYIPHHGIFKRHGDTSKIRVVFNASAPTTTGISLNDLLFSGPKLQPLISDILTKFRQFPFVFTADIRQMFRQISIHPSHYRYQCILWRENESDPLRVFYLTTVAYGTRAAPYLALRTLKQLASDEGVNFPEAAQALLHHIYVDDLLVGGHSLQEAIHLRDMIANLLQLGGFHLAKWRANHSALLPLADCGVSPSDSTESLLLGIPWDSESDHFTITFNFDFSSNGHPTKRKILAFVAQIFDPCGWTAPIVFSAKFFLQRLWAHSLEWDTPLPSALAAEWHSLSSSIHNQSYNIPRSIGVNSSSLCLHGFADASERGYAAVIYIVGEFPNIPVLVAAKTRVAPLKRLTIPRLELCAALLLAQLAAHFYNLFSSFLSIDSIHLWSDSQIVLHWLNLEPYKLKTFVATRVAQITTLITASWHYVPSASNPADLASRGISPHRPTLTPLWWSGPSWLSQPDLWPNMSISIPSSSCTEEVKPSLSVLHTVTCDNALLPEFSSWTTLLSVIKVILSWRKPSPSDLPITYRVIHAICFYLQQHSFAVEYQQILRSQKVSTRLQRLSPYIDSHSLIRVGGRLSNATPTTDSHPILLPKDHPFVILLIKHYHQALCHCGLVTLQAYLASKFWILSSRQIIRKCIYQCIPCFRTRPKHTIPLMGDLPHFRVNPSPPFLHTGMDYAGPFSVKSSTLKRAPLLKVYLCIFICMATKAIHMEVALDLSTSAFLDVLKRFVSRRGCPAILYSDCGTNFIGASSTLNKQFNRLQSSPDIPDNLKSFYLQHGIQFNFNPPSAPHQGGLWERAVQSAKRHLSRTLGTQTPSLPVFSSLIIQIEGILNSRPICVLSSDPSDLSVLTPGHFLLGRSLASLPPLDATTGDGSVKHYNLLQNFLQTFWNRWVKEYLPALQVRAKWCRPHPNLQVGDIVLLEEPHAPPRAWPLAIITSVHSGTDGVVRRVELRTSSGVFLRPVTKVYRLPLN